MASEFCSIKKILLRCARGGALSQDASVHSAHSADVPADKTLNKINVIQEWSPPSLQASEGVLLRANEYPILRSASAKQDGWGGIRTPGSTTRL